MLVYIHSRMPSYIYSLIDTSITHINPISMRTYINTLLQNRDTMVLSHSFRLHKTVHSAASPYPQNPVTYTFFSHFKTALLTVLELGSPPSRFLDEVPYKYSV